MMKQVEEQIDQFRKGQSAPRNVTAFVAAGHPDDVAVKGFTEALRTEDAQVRLQIVKLLVDLGRKTDPLYKQGIELIRNQSVIRALLTEAISQAGMARDAALDAVQTRVPPEMIANFSSNLPDNLRQWPDSTALLIIAKGKIGNALPVVRELEGMPRWSKETSLLIAKAALGDQATENTFVEPFLATTDPVEKERLARLVGFIGTRSALTALASQMRSGLVFLQEGNFKRSVRLKIMEALAYNFPDKIFLHDNAIINDSGYERVEKFCEETFGIQWRTARPPYLAVQGFPTP
ncbi:MAG: hypothetical protein V2B19_00540 [Pseudomonadota bacterium]